MKIILAVTPPHHLEFATLADLGKHYGIIADAHLRESLEAKTIKEARFAEGKAQAYAAISWSLQHAETKIKYEYHNCEDCAVKIPLVA